MKKEKLKKLNSNQEGSISGGYVYHNEGPSTRPSIFKDQKDDILKDSTKTWEVVDDASGYTVGRYATKEKAIEMATQKSQSSDILTKEELDRLKNINNW